MPGRRQVRVVRHSKLSCQGNKGNRASCSLKVAGVMLSDCQWLAGQQTHRTVLWPILFMHRVAACCVASCCIVLHSVMPEHSCMQPLQTPSQHRRSTQPCLLIFIDHPWQAISTLCCCPPPLLLACARRCSCAKSGGKPGESAPRKRKVQKAGRDYAHAEACQVRLSIPSKSTDLWRQSSECCQSE